MMNGEDTEEYVSRDQLLEVAVFGKQVEIFWASELGQYIQQRIVTERATAIAELASADRHDPGAIGKWQDQIAMVNLLEDWITQLIQDGMQAANVLEEN